MIIKRCYVLCAVRLQLFDINQQKRFICQDHQKVFCALFGSFAALRYQSNKRDLFVMISKRFYVLCAVGQCAVLSVHKGVPTLSLSAVSSGFFLDIRLC